MTEAEWLACESPGRMVHYLEEAGSERKLRLFAHACCRRIEHLLSDPRSHRAVAALERYADGELERTQLDRWYSEAKAAVEEIEAPLHRDGVIHSNTDSMAACAVLCSATPEYTPTRREAFSSSAPGSAAYYASFAMASAVNEQSGAGGRFEAAERAESIIQVHLLRDVFGNPFRPVSADPRWRTSAAIGLADSMYETRDFAAMPVLADALEEAGCDHPDVLAHCRGPGPHVRGCWVIDLILGRS